MNQSTISQTPHTSETPDANQDHSSHAPSSPLTKFQSKRRRMMLLFAGLMFIVMSGIISGVYLLQQSNDNRSSASQAAWTLSNYGCRLPVSIVNTSRTVVDGYPAKVRVAYSVFSTLPAQCQPQSDYRDIRFTTFNGEELPYAIEINNNQQKFISFHVRLNQLQNDQNNIWMYVGNPTDKSAANPKAAYDYYQDFNSFNPTVKFGVFTDLHHDGTENHYWTAPDGRAASLRNALPRLSYIISEMNSWNAEFLVSLGDLITAENFTPQNVPPYPNPPTEMTGELTAEESKRTDYDLAVKSRKDLQAVESAMRKFSGERYYVSSNHEFYFLSHDDVIAGNNAILSGQGVKGDTRATSAEDRTSNFSFDKGGVKFIGIDLQYDYSDPGPDNRYRHRGPEGGSNYGEGYMPEWQLEWLDSTLANTQNPAIIFSPSHLENADYLEDELPAEQSACETQLTQNYCTAQNCQSNPQQCITLCKDLGEYRRVRNAAAIRAVLEKHTDKVLLVLQGNDHARAHYVTNGINYLTLDGAESIEDKDVSYFKFEIDPVQKLVSLQAYGKDNTYSITYANGKMNITNNMAKEFLVAPMNFGSIGKKVLQRNDRKLTQDAMMIHGEWSIAPTAPAQQLGMGFLTDADKLSVSHRCASDGRPRKHSLAGIRRVFANKGENNYIGTEVVANGESTTTLDVASTTTSGTFWTQLYDGQINSWYSDGARGGALPALTAPQSNMSPGVWVFDTTTASLDSLVVRTTVAPEPTSTVGTTFEVNQTSRQNIFPRPTSTTAPRATIRFIQ